MKRKTMTRTLQSEKAPQAMARINREVLDLLARAAETVRLNNENFEKTGRTDWGYVGNADHYREALKRLVGEEV